LGFDEWTGGAYIYKQDGTTGRWKRVDVLTPGKETDASAKFGWSVDVDVNQRQPLIVVDAH